jgi:YfiH family protein
MHDLIHPDIFNGTVKAFFTSKSVGADIDRISSILGIKKTDIYLPVQKHTDRVLALDSDLGSVEADAVITQRKGLLIGVQVADCVPILLFDSAKSAVGAVHAGWRGTAGRIIIKAIERMMDLYGSSPEDISVAIGPSIKGGCYEVGREVKDAIRDVMGDGDYSSLLNGKYYIDLPRANAVQAMSTGVPVENIWTSHVCTHCQPDGFHSYRHHQDHSGRQGGFIGVL